MTAEPLVALDAVAFRFGDYPEKKFGCTREQFIAANGRSGTIPLGLNPTTFDHFRPGQKNGLEGETGTATFSVEDDTDLVRVKLSIPPWVDRIRTKYKLGLSSSFNSRLDRKLEQVDWVERPHITDCVVFSADDGIEHFVTFSDEPPGAPDPYSPQQTHDYIRTHYPELCGDADDPDDEVTETLRALHDHARACGAECPGYEPEDDDQPPNQKGTKVNGQDDHDETVDFAEERRKLEADREEFNRMAKIQEKRHADFLNRDAVTFSRELTTGVGAVLPPTKAKPLAELYKHLATLDEGRDEKVTFSDSAGKTVEGGLLDAFKSLLHGLPRLGLHEQVDFSDLDSEPSEAQAKAATEAQKRESDDNKAFIGGFGRRA